MVCLRKKEALRCLLKIEVETMEGIPPSWQHKFKISILLSFKSTMMTSKSWSTDLRDLLEVRSLTILMRIL